MATEKEMFELLGRLLTDPELRKTLLDDPQKVAAGLGITLTEEQAAALKESDLTGALEGLDERLSKKANILTIIMPTSL
jgi:hypothetical protein